MLSVSFQQPLRLMCVSPSPSHQLTSSDWLCVSDLATPTAEDVRQWGSRRQATSSTHEKHKHHDWLVR